jgi:hypothetical protein
MKIVSSSHNDKTCYNNLNAVADGHLYEQIVAVASMPLPPNYESFPPGQRQRIGLSRIAEQFTWTPVKAARKAKEGSELGASIVKYLDIVEGDDCTQKACVIAGTITARLGKIATDIMLVANQKQVLAQQRARTQPSPPLDI